MIFSAKLSELSDSRDNNFNLMRLGAALAVVLSHSFILSYNEPNTIPRGLGYLAVNCFFIMSGFLVCKSVINRQAAKTFYMARILRIYPALIISALLCVFAIGPLQTTESLFSYFSDSQTYKFLAKNSLLVFGVEYALPSVFTNRGSQQMVNTPIWTLVYEVYLYLFIGILGAFTLKRRNGNTRLFACLVVGLSAIALLTYIYNITVQGFDSPLIKNSIRFSALFGIGATFYIVRRFVRLSPWILLALIAILVLSINVHILHKAILYPALAYALLYIAYIPRGFLLKFNALGDYSYGVYIFAYPIQQSIANWYPGISALELFLSSLAVTLLLAVVSWHLVESKSLSLKAKF